MTRNLSCSFIVALLASVSLLPVLPAAAVPLFGPSDLVLAIDIDDVPDSRIPGAAQAPASAVDQQVSPGFTKYLNFGGPRTGLIVTPAAGSSVVKSLQLRAANDSPERDPLSFELYGTNDPITSTDHSFGDLENWFGISSGLSGLTTNPGRNALGSIIDFGGSSTAYTSYKVVFPTLRDFPNTNSMQVADVALFTEVGGLGTQILAAGDPAIAIDDHGSQSRYPAGEKPSKVLDGDPGTKYLNFGKENTGIIVARADAMRSIVTGLTFTTAGDQPNRDPLTWDLFGTNDPISSVDNSLGNAESWTLVDSGLSGLGVDPGRQADGAPVAVINSTAYGAYRLVFTSLRDAGAVDSMQLANISFDGVVVPEPGTIVLLLVGCVASFGRRK